MGPNEPIGPGPKCKALRFVTAMYLFYFARFTVTIFRPRDVASTRCPRWRFPTMLRHATAIRYDTVKDATMFHDGDALHDDDVSTMAIR
jgi:hypothetical protein